MIEFAQNKLYLTAFVFFLFVTICLVLNYYIKKVAREECEKLLKRKKNYKDRRNRKNRREKTFRDEQPVDIIKHTDMDSYIDPIEHHNDMDNMENLDNMDGPNDEIISNKRLSRFEEDQIIHM